MNRTAFFASVRKSFGALSQPQVDGFTKILDEWERRALTDVRWLAYMLATCWHETGRKMQPIREGGGEAYLKTKKYYPWVGEGLVQVTWEVNARKFGATKPGDLLNWPKALDALFQGMTLGMFTGKRLADYFSGASNNPIGARRIINGLDKAETIAGYHDGFLVALNAAKVEPILPPKPAAPAPPAKPVVPPPAPAQVAAANPGIVARFLGALARRS